MTRFADELRGAEGERCTVKGYVGTVVKVVENGHRALVAFDDGGTEAYSYDEIELDGHERP